MRKVLNTVQLISMIFFQGALKAQTFDEQIVLFINNSSTGFSSLKGESLGTQEGLDIYDCTLALDGFEITLVDMETNYMVYGVATDLNKANLNLAMMRMLPPRGFTASDSDEGATMTMTEGAIRQVTYISGDYLTIINTVYFDDNSISLTITGE